METPAASSDEVSPLTRNFYDNCGPTRVQPEASESKSTSESGQPAQLSQQQCLGSQSTQLPLSKLETNFVSESAQAPIAAQALDRVATDSPLPLAGPTGPAPTVGDVLQLTTATSQVQSQQPLSKDSQQHRQQCTESSADEQAPEPTASSAALTPPPSDAPSEPAGSDMSVGHDSGNESDTREPSEAIEAVTNSQLDFAKRDIGESLQLGRSEPALSARTLGGGHPLVGSNGSEHSNLGSRLVKSRHGSESSIVSTASMPDPPAMPADDDERIRTPVGVMLSRRSSLDIGLRQPFGTSSRSSSKSSTHDDATAGEPDATNTNSNSTASSQRWDFGSQPLPAKRSKPYEPAKFILHTESDGQTSPTVPPSHPGALRSGVASMSHQLLQDAARDHPHHRQLHAGILRHTASHSQLLECSRNPAGVCQLSGAAPRKRGSRLSEVSSLDSVPPLRERPLRQLREPRQPMYIPAVLRPTQAASYKATGASRLEPTHHNSHNASAMPDRRHWKPDDSADSCRACGSAFSLFRRKHHCRKCGDVFCAQDSRHTIGLDRYLKYNLFGQPCRACTSCAADFAKYASDVPRLQDMSTSEAERVTGISASALAIAERDDDLTQPTPHFVGSLVTAQDWSTF